MSVLETISVEMSVVLGAAQVPIRQVLKMGRGAVIPLDCAEDEPSEIHVNGAAVARGRIIVAHDALSIEVIEIIRRDRA